MGIVFLALAFTWAFGSNSRAVHFLLLVVRVLSVVGPLLFEWNDNRQQAKRNEERVAEFERRIPELAKKYPIIGPNHPSEPHSGLWLTREELVREIKRTWPQSEYAYPYA